MKFSHFLLIPALLVLFSGCSKDEPTEEQVFFFNGTFNGQEVSFSTASIQYSQGEDFSTGKIDYGQNSRLSNPISLSDNTYVAFDLRFCEKPSLDVIEQLIGNTPGSAIKTFPSLRVSALINDTPFNSGTTSITNNVNFTRVEIMEPEDDFHPIFETGRVMALHGNIDLQSDGNRLKGNFSLKLVEIE